jgi:uncharacterized Tic20 family protein
MAGSRRTKVPWRARRERNRRYKFSDKTHPVGGVVAFVLGCISLGVVILSIVISEQAQGEAKMIVGLLGILAMLLSLVGFFLAISAVRKKEIHYRFPVMGIVLNGVLAVFLLGLYILGAAML